MSIVARGVLSADDAELKLTRLLAPDALFQLDAAVALLASARATILRPVTPR